MCGSLWVLWLSKSDEVGKRCQESDWRNMTSEPDEAQLKFLNLSLEY